MELVKLTEKEFKTFADKHEQVTFHQTKEWSHLKAKNGWTGHFVGLKDNKKIIAAALLLAKNVPIVKKKMFYSPRGFLIDYNNKDVLETFTKEIKEYAKKEGAIFVKIDPYIPYQEHNNAGDIVEDGFNNNNIVENLKNLGYKHTGFTKMNENLQPRWMFVTNVKGKTFEEAKQDFDGKTKRILKKNAKTMISVRELEKEELPIFKDIMQSTSDRREFVDRPLSYYESMWNAFHDEKHLKIMVSELNIKDYLETLNQDLETVIKEIKEREERKTADVNEQKFQAKQKESKEKQEKLENQIKEMSELKEKHGNKIILGGMLFLLYGNEIVYLMGGSYKEFLHFQSAYSIHEYMIKYTIENNYENYNFYGITGIFDESNPLYGIYFSKKGFGGNVVELIGEFDLIISKFWYTTYNIAFGTYHTLKNLKKKIIK